MGRPAEMPAEMPPKHDPNFQNLLIENMLTPKPVLWAAPTIKRQVLGMACGGFHMVILCRENGNSDVRVSLSGLNKYGQLGHGDAKERQELTPIKALDGKNIFKVGGGEHFSFSLDMTGCELHTWGRANYSQIGIYDEMLKAGSVYCRPQLV